MMEWEYIGFEKVLLDVTSGNVKIQKKDYNEKGLIPIIDQGQEYSEGFTDNEELSFKGELPVIVFGDHTRVIKYVDERFCLGADGVRVLKPQAYYDAKFLFYYLNYSGIPSKGYSRHFKFLKEKQFPFLALSEQRRIVEILDQADEIRKLRKQADEKAEKIIPALFYKMFGDPIELMKGDNSIALSEFNIEFQNGFACGEKDIVDGTPHLRMNNIDDLGILNLDLVRTVPNSFDKERYRLNNGDVLFMSTNSDDKIGKSCVFNIEEDRHFLFSNHLIRLRIFDDRISPEYLSTYLHLLWAKRFYPSIAKRWVNQSTISLQNLKNIKVFVPFKEKLNKLTDAIKNLNDNRKFRNNSLSVINSLFNNLLSKAFDGSLTASWREAHMKELLKEMEEQKKYLEQVK